MEEYSLYFFYHPEDGDNTYLQKVDTYHIMWNLHC